MLDFHVKDIDGKDVDLAKYKGKVLLIVNTASQCGYTPQYKDLQAIYEKYKDQGFEVLAFPANEFGSQEPGDNQQIKEFCSTNYKVSFPLFSKIVVKGEGIHPLYAFLTSEQTNPKFAGKIAWNFAKFLVNRKGEVIGRFGPGSALVGEGHRRDREGTRREVIAASRRRSWRAFSTRSGLPRRAALKYDAVHGELPTPGGPLMAIGSQVYTRPRNSPSPDPGYPENSYEEGSWQCRRRVADTDRFATKSAGSRAIMPMTTTRARPEQRLGRDHRAGTGHGPRGGCLLLQL